MKAQNPYKVLLLNPRSMENRNLTSPTLVPSGLQEIFFFLRQNDVEVKILNFDLYDSKEDKNLLCDQKYDVIGISTGTSYRYLHALELIKIIRGEYKNSVKIFVGGTHASALPEDFLSTDIKARPDYVVIGAGEHIMLDAAHGASMAKYATPHKGILHAQNGCSNIPLIKYDFVESQLNSGLEFCPNSCTAIINLSRGCVGRCTFCTQSVSQHRYVCLSIDIALEIVESLKHLPKQVKTVFFSDPCFGYKKAWRREIFKALKQLRRLSFGVMMRIEPLQEDDFELLADSNITLDIGVETFSPRMLRIMNKTKDPLSYIKIARKIIGYCFESNVSVEVNLLSNHPGETPSTTKETLNTIRLLHNKHGDSFKPITFEYGLFPGTRVFQHQSFYESKYGARFLFPHWWHNPKNQWTAARTCIPSNTFGRTLPEMLQRKRDWERALEKIVGKWY